MPYVVVVVWENQLGESVTYESVPITETEAHSLAAEYRAHGHEVFVRFVDASVSDPRRSVRGHEQETHRPHVHASE